MLLLHGIMAGCYAPPGTRQHLHGFGFRVEGLGFRVSG